jgi:hypothetical protein
MWKHVSSSGRKVIRTWRTGVPSRTSSSAAARASRPVARASRARGIGGRTPRRGTSAFGTPSCELGWAGLKPGPANCGYALFWADSATTFTRPGCNIVGLRLTGLLFSLALCSFRRAVIASTASSSH